uniref:Uncharacterized protein n=1 Tax=Cacopsylla melanoneura TaxID=428564 RepID=A0A8D8QWX8_9HEMI
MFDITSTLNSNKTWSHIKSFVTSNGILLVMFKRNLLAFAKFCIESSSWNYKDCSSQSIGDNIIIEIASVRDKLILLDSRGQLYHYKLGLCSPEQSLEKVGHLSCEEVLAACISKSFLICLTCDKSQTISVQCYNLESKAVKSCSFIQVKSSSSKYILRALAVGSSETVLIGCPDGSIVECSVDCSHIEILHQCSELVVDIFQLDDMFYFVQSDGCLLEYTNQGRVSIKYLPQSVPKRCQFIPPHSLVYCDDRTTFLYDMTESTGNELRVKGVIDLSHSEGILFLLTLQGLVYSLQDTTSDAFLTKIKQYDQLNRTLDTVDGELNAMAIFMRAQQLRCHFMTRLCITQGALDWSYKFSLDLTHTCDGVSFAKDSWCCHIGLTKHNIVLPLSYDLGSGDRIQLSFFLNDYVPTSYVNIKISLVSGSNGDLLIPVTDSVLTLLSFCSPSLPLSSPLPYQRTVEGVAGDILDRACVDIRHNFTRAAWERIHRDKSVTLKHGKDLIELCVDERNRQLLIKSTSEEVSQSVAQIIKAGFISVGFLYSDYLRLNSLKQQAEIDQIEDTESSGVVANLNLNLVKSI